MKPLILIIILIAGICFSCREVYESNVNAEQNVLVVNGLITDEARPYIVKLTMASQYNKNDSNLYVSNAHVRILDDEGNISLLSESYPGVYVTNPAELLGKPGRSYSLHIETSDNKVYESAFQLLSPNNFKDTVYAEFSSQDELVEDNYGGISKVTTQGIDMLIDINNNTDTLPRFRFQNIVLVESEFTVFLGPTYFCWSTLNPSDLVNITDDKYQTTLSSIQKHKLGFIPTTYYYNTFDPNNAEVKAYVVNRILRVDKYCINKETFQFYKNVNMLLSAQGKIFDPIAFNFRGNIICKTNPQELVLGFFEASSVKSDFYAVKPGEKNVIKVPSRVLPSSPGKVVNIPPSFWVY